MPQNPQVLTPTDYLSERERDQNNGFKHLLPRLRQGKVSFEVFKKSAQERLDIKREGGEGSDNARQVEKATEMGVRGEGAEVGAKAPLQPAAKKPKAQTSLKNAKARKKP